MNYNRIKNFFIKQKVVIILCAAVCLIYLPILFLFCHYSVANASGYSFPVILGDSSEYVKLAEDIIHQAGASLQDHITPGYPLFLSFALSIFKSYYVVSLIQITLVLFNSLLIYKIARKIVSPAAGWLAAFLYIINPSTLFYSMVLMSDTLFTFLLVSSIYIVFFADSKNNSRRLLVAGFLVGFAILVRPIGFFLPFIFVVFYVWFKKETISFKKIIYLTVIFCISCSIVLLPWIIRNKVVNNVWSISSLGAFNLFHYNLPLFLSVRDSTDIGMVRDDLYKQTNGLNEEQAKQFAHATEISHIVFNYISQDPVGYFSFHLNRLPQFFGGNSSKNFYVNTLESIYHKANPFPEKSLLIDDFLVKKNISALMARLKSQSFFVVEYVVWLIILILSIISIISKKYRQQAVLFIVLALYFGILTGPVTHVRYRLPAEPFMFLSAVMGGSYLKQQLKRIFLFLRTRSLPHCQ